MKSSQLWHYGLLVIVLIQPICNISAQVIDQNTAQNPLITKDAESNAGFKNKIVFDFKNRSLENKLPNSIKRGEFYQIEVKNINLNLFKVALNTTDTLLSGPLSTPTFGDIPIDAISSAVSGVSELFAKLPQITEPGQVYYLDQGFNREKNVQATDDILEEFDKHKNSLVENLNELRLIVTKIEKIKLLVYEYRFKALKLEWNPTNAFNTSNVLDSIIATRKKLATIQKNIGQLNQAYHTFAKNNSSRLKQKPAYEQLDKHIKDEYNNVLSLISKTLDSVNPDRTSGLLASIVFLENNAHSTYLSVPLQFNGDQAIVSLSIIPREEKYLQNTYKTKFIFPVFRENYQALGLSFYWTTLHNEAYSTIGMEADDSTRFRILEEDVTASEIGLAALMRFGKKFQKNNLGLHITFGPGVSISKNIKPRVLVGGGFTLGDKHRLALDAGVVAGYVDRLSKALDTSTLLEERPETVHVSKLGAGVFVSIGYLFIL